MDYTIGYLRSTPVSVLNWESAELENKTFILLGERKGRVLSPVNILDVTSDGCDANSVVCYIQDVTLVPF